MTGLPYQWRPLGTERRQPKPGDVLPFEHAAWRVLSVEHREVTRDGSTTKRTFVAVRPVSSSSTMTAADEDRHLSLPAGQWWDVYPDPRHYPVCSTCHEPLPCRDKAAEDTAARAAADLERYLTPGVCPACLEPVRIRQKTRTWQENAMVPGGPSVTFHLRWDCWDKARAYELAWAAQDPERKLTLTCSGSIARHGDNTFECTAGDDCPDAMAWHESYRTCRYIGCTDPACRRLEGWDCHPKPGDRRRLNGADA